MENFMADFAMLLLCVISALLILVVLLQRGRGGGLAGAFGGLGGQSAFGTKAGDVFTKITIGLVTAWVLLAGISGVLARKASSKFVEDPATVTVGDDEISAVDGDSAGDATSADVDEQTDAGGASSLGTVDDGDEGAGSASATGSGTDTNEGETDSSAADDAADASSEADDAEAAASSDKPAAENGDADGKE